MRASCSKFAWAIPLISIALLLGENAARAEVPDRASIVRAEEAFDEGIAAWKRGDLTTAEAKLRVAHGIVKTPVTGLPLGKVLRDEGKWVEARTHLAEVAALPDYPGMSAQARSDRDDARALTTELDRDTPTLVVRITTPTPTTTRGVTIDGKPYALDQLASPMRVDPGEHVVGVTGDDPPCPSSSMRIATGDKRTLTWEIDPKADSNAAAGAAPSGSSGELRPFYPWPWIGFGVGAIAFVIGGVSGLVAFNKRSELKKECSATGACPLSAHDDLLAARRTAATSTVAFVVGGAAVAFGAGALLLRPSAKTPPSIPPKCQGPLLKAMSSPTPTPSHASRPPDLSLHLSPAGVWGTF